MSLLLQVLDFVKKKRLDVMDVHDVVWLFFGWWWCVWCEAGVFFFTKATYNCLVICGQPGALGNFETVYPCPSTSAVFFSKVR